MEVLKVILLSGLLVCVGTLLRRREIFTSPIVIVIKNEDLKTFVPFVV